MKYKKISKVVQIRFNNENIKAPRIQQCCPSRQWRSGYRSYLNVCCGHHEFNHDQLAGKNTLL